MPKFAARLIALLVALVATNGPLVSCQTEPPPRAGLEPKHPAIGFRNQRLLDEHFEKHRREFGQITKADYLRRAQILRDAPLAPEILEAKRRDGVITRFSKRDGGFLAFNKDLIIRTYFRPNDGERYFHRQASR